MILDDLGVINASSVLDVRFPKDIIIIQTDKPIYKPGQIGERLTPSIGK